ncbi:MAG: T9SS type A sorting domain-containing protein [Bacteroidota bacterium]|nr:T9SS type A sorting domain-containing protein [Bacteroidota bacterium]
MRNSFLALILFTVVVLTITSGFDVLDNSGQAGRTGSPSESTCNITCHTGFALNDGTGSITISSPDMPTWEYMPGDTYTIDVTVARVGNSLFGFDVECLTGASTPQNAGTFIITNTAQSQIKNFIVGSVTRKNVVHKLNGGVGTDTKTWSFDWICPSTNVGSVTFYATGNAANGTNTSAGDHIYRTTQVVTPAIGAGISNTDDAFGEFNIFPNPAHENISVSYTAEPGEDVSIQLISLEGKIVSTLYSGTSNGLPVQQQLQLPSDLPQGMYVVQLVHGNSSASHRVVIY